jgi:hypothetical protein
MQALLFLMALLLPSGAGAGEFVFISLTSEFSETSLHLLALAIETLT